MPSTIAESISTGVRLRGATWADEPWTDARTVTATTAGRRRGVIDDPPNACHDADPTAGSQGRAATALVDLAGPAGLESTMIVVIDQCGLQC